MLPNVILQPANSHIRLYTGQLIDPLNPDFSKIPKEDLVESIAHSLSNLCRFGGHCREFYSVAQHCVLASRICDCGEEREGLWHDKTEGCGMVDLPRPIKHANGMRAYREYEYSLDRVLNDVLYLKHDTNSVKWADDQLLVSEMRILAPQSYPFYQNQLASKGYTELLIDIEPWSPKEAKKMFLQTHYDLEGQLKQTLFETYSKLTKAVI